MNDGDLPVRRRAAAAARAATAWLQEREIYCAADGRDSLKGFGKGLARRRQKSGCVLRGFDLYFGMSAIFAPLTPIKTHLDLI